MTEKSEARHYHVLGQIICAGLHRAFRLLIGADDIQSLWEAPANTIQQYVTCSVASRGALIINAERRLGN